MLTKFFKSLTAATGLLFIFISGANAALPTITTEEIVKTLKEKPESIFLLDVRTPGEYASGHISGSTLIPMRQVPSNMGRIPKDKVVVVVCATGARSGAVVDYLLKNGYTQVKNYPQGMMGWQRSGQPIKR
jgi:rhodanese-related sulfurtransferase